MDQREEDVDSSKPFRGVVVCCTSIPPDQRTEIAQRTSDMGGIHKYDLTPDVTHLIVGDYDTPKYRHVAKERPDIMPVAAGWIEDARNMWMADQEFDFAALEAKWKLKTFESGGGIAHSPDPTERETRRLLCCLTGFEDNDVRAMIEEKVKSNGGDYVGDLSRRVTHLITYKPEGKKYKAALNWGIRTVSIEWLNDSIERGMILNEACYDPALPQEERGVGAWTRKEVRRASTGKRLREDPAVAGQGKRKLRKTASMKLNSQSENLWGDILNQQTSFNQSNVMSEGQSPDVSHIGLDDSIISRHSEVAQPEEQPADDPTQSKGGVFASCRFSVHGFTPAKTNVVCEHLTSHGAGISPSVEDLASPDHPEPPTQRFLVVPQTSQPDTHPKLPEGVHIVTEFYLERCIHGRKLFGPDDHVLGRPFPRFPIEGFEGLRICTTGFKDEQLNQIEKTVVQLGATYAERFNAQASLLVSPALDRVLRQKLDFALLAGIPVVDAEWLWQCIAMGFFVPWEGYLLQKPGPKAAQRRDSNGAKEQDRRSLQKTISEPIMPRKPKPDSIKAPPAKERADRIAFEEDRPAVRVTARDPFVTREEAEESHYETAPTHQFENPVAKHTEPTILKEASSTALNRSPSSPRQKAAAPASPPPPQQPRQFRRFPTEGTIADSEAAEGSQALTATTPSRHDPESPTTQNQHHQPQEGAADEEGRGAAAAREQQLEREREKQEMSRRLNSLMRGSHNHNYNNNNSNHNSDGTEPEGAKTMTRPQRRKRDVLGRAVSNVSAASSNASTESPVHATANAANSASTTAATTGGKPPTAGSGSFASVVSGASGGGGAMQQLFDKMLDSSAEDHNHNQQPPPPATQLQYDVPEAARQRAAIMDRMKKLRRGRGGAKDKDRDEGGDGEGDRDKDAGGVGAGDDGGAERRRGRVKATLASLGADGAAGVATRRTTRRQKGF
ncbi:hypothetical protein DL763_010668 [Monosporascus cannonballus]|nr:hypothetical protein DL763_010668 [Monosporascus cannonballus]